MMIFLEGTDCDYLDRIHDGPFIPKKLIPSTIIDGSNQPEHYVVDAVMSNKVITYKTIKEIWGALEVQCQGTKEIRMNRRSVLT